MSTRLLDKTRKLGNILRNSSLDKASISELARTVSSLIMANIYLVSKEGEVLLSCEKEDSAGILSLGSTLPKESVNFLLDIYSTKENIHLNEIGLSEKFDEFMIISPVEIKNKRFSSLIVLRENDPFDIEDVILAEYFSNMLSVLYYSEENQKNDDNKRSKVAAKNAFDSLSFKEIKAAKALLRELPKEGGLLVTSNISKKYDITRSIIINCIKKLESAGIIEARSMGAKGTNVKIKNILIYDEVFKDSADI